MEYILQIIVCRSNNILHTITHLFHPSVKPQGSRDNPHPLYTLLLFIHLWALLLKFIGNPHQKVKRKTDERTDSRPLFSVLLSCWWVESSSAVEWIEGVLRSTSSIFFPASSRGMRVIDVEMSFGARSIKVKNMQMYVLG